MSRMFFRMLSDQARLTLALARQEAERLGSRIMGTEHLLLGVLRLPDSAAAHALGELGVDVEELRAAVEFEASGEARGRSPSGLRDSGIVVVRSAGPGGLTHAARSAIALAVDEARRLKSPAVDAGHLLLGLLRQDDGIAATVLARFDITLDQVVAQLPHDAIAQQAPDPSGGPKTNVVTCRLDDRAVDALDALVEAGIRPTRSDAAAWLISTGIEAHRTLFDRVHATVDEIRKLRLEAQTIAGQVCTYDDDGDLLAGASRTLPDADASLGASEDHEGQARAGRGAARGRHRRGM